MRCRASRQTAGSLDANAHICRDDASPVCHGDCARNTSRSPPETGLRHPTSEGQAPHTGRLNTTMPDVVGWSSAAWQARGQGFESPKLHDQRLRVAGLVAPPKLSLESDRLAEVLALAVTNDDYSGSA